MESPRCGNALTLGTASGERMVHRCWRRTVRSGLALLTLLGAVPAFAQAPKAPREDLTIDPAAMQKPWTGDLDGMIERRIIRVLTVNSKTFYFIDKGVQRGIVVDYFRLFEKELNKKLAAEKKLKRQEPEGAGGIHPGPARPAAARAGGRQGRHRRRQSHDHAGAPETGGLLRRRY